MIEDPTTETPVAGTDEQPLITEDVLVEEVSIDGMCGVY
jgi:mycofactocin precursor